MPPSPFRRVEAVRAGPRALGILVPPGKRTILIVRPRTLDCDLLPLAPAAGEGPRRFLELDRDDTARLGKELYFALEALPHGGPGQVEVLPLADGACLLQARVGAITLLGCCRSPGRAYQPMRYAGLEQARDAAERLTAILSPPPETTQEIYFNTQSFAG